MNSFITPTPAVSRQLRTASELTERSRAGTGRAAVLIVFALAGFLLLGQAKAVGNSAPVLADTNVYLAAQDQVSLAPAGAVGTSISTLVDLANDGVGLHNNVTDTDTGALVGIAVIGANTVPPYGGVWWYSTDKGASWLELGAVSDGSARVLAADGDTRIYFQNVAAFVGTIPAAITFRAWDRTSGHNNGDANVNTSGSNNGGTTAFSTATDSANLTINAVNLAPVLAGIDDTLASFSESLPTAVPITGSAFTVTDSDSATLVSASVQITGHYAAGEDVLEFTDAFGIHGTWDRVNGKLTLTGTFAPSIYQSALRSVTYRNLSDAPSTLTRTVSIYVNDGSGVNNLSNTATRDITVAEANDPPTITTIADQTIDEDTSTGEIVFTVSDPEADKAATLYDNTVTPHPNGLVVSPGNGIEFGDQVTLAGSDRLAADFMFGLYFIGAASASKKAELFIYSNTGLNNTPSTLLYQSGEFPLENGANLLSVPAFSLNLPDTFTWTVKVNGIDSGETAGLLLYDPPTVGSSLGDYWQKNTDGTWSTRLVSSGTVNANFASRVAKANGLTVTSSVVSSTPSGLVTTGNVVLSSDMGSTRTVTVTPASNMSGTATVRITVSDGTLSASDDFVVTVNAVNDTPVLSGLGGTAPFTEALSATQLASGATVSDLELDAANSSYNGATLTLARHGGANGQDIFGFTGPTVSVSGSDLVVSSTPRATFTSTAGMLTIVFNSNSRSSDADDILQAITYSNNSDAPPANVQIDYTFSDGNTGAQGSGLAQSATGSVTVNIESANDAPTVTGFAPITVVESFSTVGPATWSVPAGVTSVDVLVVAGGGAGGADVGGGGGGGQVISSPNVSVTGGQTASITVGAGGARGTASQYGFKGGDSSFAIGATTLTAVGGSGGAGRNQAYAGGIGFNGGGGSYDFADATSFIGGNPGGASAGGGNTANPNGNGGGGGAGGAGVAGTTSKAGDGGPGVSSSISGTLTTYGGGGGGSLYNINISSPSPNGLGVDGGGNGGFGSVLGTDGVAGRGGGGGGGPSSGSPGSNGVGGSGIVILRYTSATVFTVTEDVAGNLLFTGTPFADVDSASLTVTLTVSDGTITGNAGTGVTVGGTATARTFGGTVNDLNAYFTTPGQITYQGAANNTTSRTLTITSSDGILSSGSATATISFTAANDAPVLSGLGGTAPFTEALSATQLASGATVSDLELDAANSSYNGATLTLARHGGASSEDEFVFAGGVTVETPNNLKIGTVSKATFTSSGGMLTISFNSSAQASDPDTILSSIFYRNLSDTPPASVQIDYTFKDGTLVTQGSGGEKTATGSVTVNITAVNDAPGLSVIANGVPYTEDGPPVVLVSSALVSDAELDAANNYNGATLTVARQSSLDPDVLSPNPEDVFGFSSSVVIDGVNLEIGGVSKATFSATAGMLTITFANNPQAIDVNTILRSITYANSSDTPPSSVTINYRFNDGTDSTTEPVTVNISPANDAPTAVADTIALHEGTVQSIPTTIPLTNDIKGDTAESGQTLTVISVAATATTHGTVTLSGTTITYTPEQDYVGLADFNYTIEDDGTTAGNPDHKQATGTVNLVIGAVNDSPTAGADNKATPEDVPLTFSASDLTENDVPGPATATDEATQTLTVSAVSPASANGGTVSLGGGIITYIPLSNFVGSDSFTYTVTDNGTTIFLNFSNAEPDPKQATGTVTVTVTAVDDPPVLEKNLGLTVNEGSFGTIGDGKLSVADADTGASSLVYTLVLPPAHGSLKKSGAVLGSGATFTQFDINTDTAITYQHDGSETTADQFTFTVSDGTGTIGHTPFEITITPLNDVPALATNAGLTVNEGGSGVIGANELSATDDDNSPEQLVFTLVTPPIHGTLMNNGTPIDASGTFTQSEINTGWMITYQHNGDEPSTTLPNDQFTFTVTDDLAPPLSPQTFNLTVTPVNDPPTITLSGNVSPRVVDDKHTIQPFEATSGTGVTITDDDSASLTVTVIQDHPDKGVLETGTSGFSGSGGVYTLTGTSVTPAAATSALRSLVFRPNGNRVPVGSSEQVSFTIQVTDGNTSSSDNRTSVIVNSVNDAPVIVAISINEPAVTLDVTTPVAVPENAPPFTRVAKIVAIDPDAAQGLRYEIVSVSPPTDALAIDPFGGQITVNGPLNYEDSAHRSFQLVVKVTDDLGSSDSKTITVDVADVNEPPIASDAVFSVAENTTALTPTPLVVASDPDSNAGPNGTLHYAISSADPDSPFSINDATTGAITATGPFDFERRNQYSFHVTITDGGGLSTVAHVTVNVTNVNENPEIENNQEFTVPETAPAGHFFGTVFATDQDFGSNLSYSITGGNTGNVFQIDPTFGHLTVNTVNTVSAPLDAETTALYTLTVTVSDNVGGSDSAAVTVHVENINKPAVTTAPAELFTNEDVALILSSTNNNRILVTDDAGTGSIEVTLSADRGKLTLASLSGISFQIGVNTSHQFRIRGTVSAINTALNGLSYLPDPDFNGTDVLEVFTDDRGTGGVGGTFTDFDLVFIHVKPVIDEAPTVTPASTVFGRQTFTGLEIHRSPKDGPEVTHFQITSVSNGTLFLNNGTTVINNGNFITAGEAAAGLRFTPDSIASGSFQVKASLNDIAPPNTASGLGGDFVTVTIPVAKADQFIHFDPIPPQVFHTNATVALTASAPGGTVGFTKLSGPATVSGNIVTLIGAGTVVIEASQGGNANFNEAPRVTQIFPVAKANQTITFATITPKTYGDPNFGFTANASSGLPVHLSVRFGPAFITLTNTIAITGAGTVGITAFQEGDPNYNPAFSVDQFFDVFKASLVVTANAKSRLFGEPNPPLDGNVVGIKNNDPITATYSSPANPLSPPGDYEIIPQVQDPAGRLGNYALTINRGTLTVLGDRAQVAEPQSVETNEDTAIAIELLGHGVKDRPLNFFVVRPPENGILLGEPPSLVYVPKLNFHGTDSFDFKVNDGIQNSLPGTVAIDVLAVNDPPKLAPVRNRAVGKNAPEQIMIVGGINAGAPDENEPLSVSVLSVEPTGIISFPVVSYLSPGTDAELKFTPVTDALGTATVTVQVSEVGGVGLQSEPQSFKVTVTERGVSVLNVTGMPSLPVTVPIRMNALGGENAVAFTLNFSPDMLLFEGASLGEDALEANFQINDNEASLGRVGLAIALNTGATFTAGQIDLIRVHFKIPGHFLGGTTPPDTHVGFGNEPVAIAVVNAEASRIPAFFKGGQVTITRGLEADVTPPPFGDGSVDVLDWTKVGRYAVGLDEIGSPSEFQRADCAPLANFGDNFVDVVDWVQAGRYAVGLDVSGPGAGPFPSFQTLARPSAARAVATKSVNSTARTVRLTDGTARAGQNFVVQVVMDAQGEENAIGFSLNFDAEALRFVGGRVGRSAAEGVLLTNARDAGKGRVGLAVALPPGQAFAPGAKELVEVEFSVAATVAEASTAINFGDAPVGRQVVSVNAAKLSGEFESILVMIERGVPATEPTRVLSLTGRTPEGDMQIQLRGEAGIQYLVEASEDLARWTTLKTVTATNGSIDFVDSESRKLAGRFYRVRRAP